MAGAIKRLNENGGARNSLDKFYTKIEYASEAIKTVEPLILLSDIIVEPSAGAGAFSTQIDHPNLKAYDLKPENEEIQEADWFQITRENIGEGKLLVVGNPPFGVRSDLAKRFIQHSIALDAETIAFVLPETFSKVLNQKETLFPSQYRLVIEESLPDESFTIEGESFHIPCAWYVWTKDSAFMSGRNLRKQLINHSPDFRFIRRGSTEADFTVNGNSGKVKTLENVTNPKSEHYIRVNDRSKIDEVRNKIADLRYDFKSSVNGGVAWIGQQEILAEYAK